MKGSNLIICLIALLTSFASHAEVDPLSDTEKKALESAMRSMDEGNQDVAIAMLEALREQHPDNYLVNYELAYSNYLAKDYDRSIKIGEKILKHTDADESVYSLVGSAYDFQGNNKKALKVYENGIKRFPKSGIIYTNIGLTHQNLKNYDKAIDAFEKSIEVNPTYHPAYYHAARLYAMSNRPMWAQIYAETHLLLSNREDRNRELGQLMLKLMQDKVKVNGNKIDINVGSLLSFGLGAKKISYEDAFDVAYSLGAAKIVADSGWTFESVKALRANAVDLISALVPPTNRMALTKLQKAAKDAGHWDAYNFYVLRYTFPEDAKKWGDDPENEKRWDDFMEFIHNSPDAVIGTRNTVSSRLLDKP